MDLCRQVAFERKEGTRIVPPWYPFHRGEGWQIARTARTTEYQTCSPIPARSRLYSSVYGDSCVSEPDLLGGLYFPTEHRFADTTRANWFHRQDHRRHRCNHGTRRDVQPRLLDEHHGNPVKPRAFTNRKSRAIMATFPIRYRETTDRVPKRTV